MNIFPLRGVEHITLVNQKQATPGVTESKLTLLTTWQANKSEVRCRSKEYNFIQKAGRLRRCHTSDLWKTILAVFGCQFILQNREEEETRK